MHNLLILLISILTLNIAFAEEKKELPPLDPSWEGIHGMVLVSQGSRVFASHLPLYHKPHNVQLLYKIEMKEIAFLNLVRDAQLVTIKPQRFNLQRLIRGEKMTIIADVYMGHFERDGMVVYKDKPIVFTKQLYVREMKELDESSTQQEYGVVELRKNERIYIHKIQKAPSYDHLMYVDQSGACLPKFRTSSAVPKRSELQYKFLNCGTMKPLYYETADFEKRKTSGF